MKLTIVLARVRMTGLRETTQVHRPDGVNWRFKLEEYARPEACLWRNNGTAADVDRANDFAKTEGYCVFTYPTTERNPLEKAKSAVMAMPA